MNQQSVRIGVSDLYFALLTADSESALTYATPDKIPGVTQIVVTRNSSVLTHYSDDKPSANIEQDGDTSIAIDLDGLSSEMKAKYLGGKYDTNSGLYYEGHGASKPYFAVGYRSQMENGKFKYTWFYKGKMSAPDETSQTKGSSVTVQQNSHTFLAVEPQNTSELVASDGNNLKRSLKSDDANLPAGVTDATLANATSGWFSTPLYIPVAA